MHETLQEYVDSRGVAIQLDRQQGVIRGVKILGLESRNGRTYLPEALAEAVPLYEQAKVNVNHPKGSPTAPRDYQDRIGVIRGAVLRSGEGLFADLHFNPKHALAEQLIWDAEHSPENVGFSHNVEARTARSGERVIVEAILRVQSVDLVADPATTRGLFESAGAVEPGAGSGAAVGTMSLDTLTVEAIQEHRPDLVEAIAGKQASEVARLCAELDRFQAAETARQKQLRVEQLLMEFHLPDPARAEGWARFLVSEPFLKMLVQSPSDEAMRQLVEERAALAKNLAVFASSDRSRPMARDPLTLAGPSPRDAKSFVEAIT